ncbi:DpnI domain-containing protein [Ancylobacter novellus]|uniref:DpnI domain-containing protein n=1 Tax=Ancylobacter novellus TaxID=921 RepID=UPI0009D7122E|nr:DpnI domain-containing protein [Ancylobacter novellus]
MATPRQLLGTFGEERVTKECSCPRCKRARTLVRLPPNFKCADVICDFCGYLAQVKASTSADVAVLPKQILGAAWGPQKLRMDAGIYFPLFLVLASKNLMQHAIYYLSADLQAPELFKPRKPLSATARRAGWTGFIYDLSAVHDAIVRLPPLRPAAPVTSPEISPET